MADPSVALLEVRFVVRFAIARSVSGSGSHTESTGRPTVHQLKTALLRLHTVSGRQRYYQRILEECLGDQKSTEPLKRMQTRRGELQIDDKLFKETFLEPLPTDAQIILVPGSMDLSVSRLAEIADRMLEV
ncbi:unnamed protein product [Schistocephalus solidus]|uniref:Patatin n=1 Tax=Schistocephalus solidus TaxID=70667 RepID=A0A183T8J5_SCHSO|nr:unnamed protein product [Schistocephalus solidus]